MDFDAVFSFIDQDRKQLCGITIKSGSNLLDNARLCLTTVVSI